MNDAGTALIAEESVREALIRAARMMAAHPPPTHMFVNHHDPATRRWLRWARAAPNHLWRSRKRFDRTTWGRR